MLELSISDIETALTDGGFAMADIVRATYYVTDVKDADAVFGELQAELKKRGALAE